MCSSLYPVAHLKSIYSCELLIMRSRGAVDPMVSTEVLPGLGAPLKLCVVVPRVVRVHEPAPGLVPALGGGVVSFCHHHTLRHHHVVVSAAIGVHRMFRFVAADAAAAAGYKLETQLDHLSHRHDTRAQQQPHRTAEVT